MGLTWLTNHFICKELYAPFVLDKDCDYEKDLRKKYNLVLKQAKAAGADKDSIAIINKYKKKVLESLRYYYRADIARSNTIIENLLRDIGNDPFAVAPLSNSYACKNRHPSPICTQFEHHFHVVKPHLHTLKSQKPYNWSSTAEL